MPNRILKEKNLTNRRINNLSAEEERFYYRLYLVCEDYGRTEALPSVLRARCFPLKIDEYTDRMIINWLNGLLREKLAILYQFEDSLYLEMSEWRKEQQIRNKYSKYPAPDTDGVILLSEIPSEAQNAPSETTKESAQENIPDTPKKLKEDKADDSPKPKKENTPYDEIVGEYNLILCQLLPKVVLVTEKRQKAMDKIWKVHSGDMELIKKVFAITSESDFLTGKKTNWKADFDFIMKPQNFVKILEGSYNNSSEFPPQTPKGGTHIPNAFAGLHEFGCED